MDTMLSYCGLDCGECPVFVATKADDNSKRQKVADSWSKMLQKELTAADINCDGCTQEGGRLF
ncbi:MAG: DUF3795 domain-containing protein, partial [bacterium]|nr:DUF3795 domain-containing protein [bacterium]